jgi:O-antigen/teichoic acid export membrane protein
LNKFLAAEDDSKDVFAYLVLKSILIFAYVLVFAAIYLLKYRYETGNNILLRIGFYAIFLELVADFFTNTMIGKRDFFYLSVVEIVSACVLFIYTIGVCFGKPDVYLLAYSKVVVPVISIIGGFFYFGEKDLFRFSMPQASHFHGFIYQKRLNAAIGNFCIYTHRIFPQYNQRTAAAGITRAIKADNAGRKVTS